MPCSCTNETLAFHGCCCDVNRCLAPEPSQGPPGPQGEQGEPGTAGTNGQNSFTASTSGFVQPAVSNAVNIPVAYGLWAVPGQAIYVQTAGFFTVNSRTSTTINATNIGAPGNASPATVIATNRLIGPAGYAGTLANPLPVVNGGTNATTATAAFDNLSPMTTNGDLISRSGGSNVRIAAGTSGQILTANGAGTLPSYQTNAPAAANITGQIAIANGGTSANTADSARTALGTAGLTDNNTYTGTQAFNGTSFAATIATFSAFLFTAAARSIYDLAGTISADFANRRLEGSWTQTFKSKTVASASTFSAWTNVETVVSTYSATGTQAITLPAGSDGRVVRIIDGGGLAGTNAITISRSGSDTILGATSYALNLNYGAVAFIFQASNTNWNRLP